MVIGACGYGATGSSAVYDLIREFEGIQSLPFDSEFIYCYQVDGLQDLQYHLTERYSKGASGDAAIKRFIDVTNFEQTPFMKHQVPPKKFKKITDEYIDSIVQGKFKGYETFDTNNVGTIRKFINLAFIKFVIVNYQKHFKKIYNSFPLRDLYISIDPDNFLEKTQKYIRDLLKAMGFELDKPILLNQPFEGNAPEQSMIFFDDPKAIVVDRDPRDLYAFYHKTLVDECRFLPVDNVETFVEQYKQIRKNQSRVSDKSKLFIQFEDMIYNYEASKEKIIDFLGLKNHLYPKRYLNPEKSINNTQLYLLYPDMKDDIKYIEEHLKDYLFDFSKYGKVEHKGTIF